MFRAMVLICLGSLAIAGSLTLPAERSRRVLHKKFLSEIWMANLYKVVSPALEIPHLGTIYPPTNVSKYMVRKVNDLKSIGVNISKNVMGAALNVARAAKNEFNAKGKHSSHWKMKVLSFPGEDCLTLCLPGGVIRIVDSEAQSGLTFNFKIQGQEGAGEAAKATLAWSIYVSLKLLFVKTGMALMAMGDCFPTRKISDAIKHNAFIDRIIINQGIICGLSSLVPTYNLTVESDGVSSLKVIIPLDLPDLRGSYERVYVPRYTVSGEPITFKINKIDVQAEVKFSLGKTLRYDKWYIRLLHLGGFEVNYYHPRHSKTIELTAALVYEIGRQAKIELKMVLHNFVKLTGGFITGKLP